MSGIFDSHAHYDDSAFDGDREQLLASLPARGVCGVINCAVDLASAKRTIAFAEAYSFIWAAIGLHPENLSASDDADLDAIETMLGHEKVVAVGEIGLDYHWDATPREVARDRFERQILLANRHGLPVIVHDREAHEDTLTLLKKHRPRGVVHCFSGSAEMAREVLDIGMYIGLGGAVTFKGAKKPLAVAKAVPADRLLLETDCPYMAPVPHRGKRCDSSMISDTAAFLADLLGVSKDALLAQTENNAKRLFQLG